MSTARRVRAPRVFSLLARDIGFDVSSIDLQIELPKRIDVLRIRDLDDQVVEISGPRWLLVQAARAAGYNVVE